MKSRTIALSLALAGLLAAPGVARAQGQPAPAASPVAKTPEQLKQEQKDKDFKKAKEDLEKELNGKKIDPTPATQLLQDLAYSLPVPLEVKESVDLTHKVLAKKIPIATDVFAALSDKQQKATDPKTNKVDMKKMIAEFRKWIDAWKPPAAAPAPVAPGAGNGGR